MARAELTREDLLATIGNARDAEYGSKPFAPLERIEQVARTGKPNKTDGASARVAYALRVAAACFVVLEQDAQVVADFEASDRA